LVGTDALLALRSADVAATAITPELIAVGERTTRERGLSVRWQLPDSQALPFADGEFDIVISCIGAMFPRSVGRVSCGRSTAEFRSG
jgi:ubiquinone/menaquinone biosynthesis C-methylase UbiE